MLTDLNPDDWKFEIMADAYLSPMDILAQWVADRPIPAFEAIDPALQSHVEELLAEQKGGPAGLFRVFYDLLF